jgi:hypothetical protein
LKGGLQSAQRLGRTDPSLFDPTARSAVELAVQRFEHLLHLRIFRIKFIEAFGIGQRLVGFAGLIAKAYQCGE